MRLYIAAMYTSNFHLSSSAFNLLHDNGRLARLYPKNVLESYHYIGKDSYIRRIREDKIKLFLDSGAFSAFTKGVKVDIKAYAKYVEKHRDFVDVASVLDAIGDPAATLENQKRLEDLGCEVLPCYHYGEPESYLEYYLDNYEYITIGGMVPIATPQLKLWLDRIWTNHLTDEHGKSRRKIHGFGLTTVSLMERYPWYSVDSSSWVQVANNGGIYLPGVGMVAISKHSPARKNFNQHYNSMSPPAQQKIRDLLEYYGFTVEQVEDHYAFRWALNALTFSLLGEKISHENKELVFNLKQEVLF